MIPVFTIKNKVELLNRLINKSQSVLDVGFWGQGKTWESPTWPHRLLIDRAAVVYGIDLVYDENVIPVTDRERYQKVAAENFTFTRTFDVVFAGDLIEHLVNPGLFLDQVKKHLTKEGKLILTTPNTFNLFVMAGKLTRPEPPINPDHTFYFNRRTIEVLLHKCGFEVEEFGFMYTLDYAHHESWKKKVLNTLYAVLALFTPKYYESLVIVAKIKT